MPGDREGDGDGDGDGDRDPLRFLKKLLRLRVGAASGDCCSSEDRSGRGSALECPLAAESAPEAEPDGKPRYLEILDFISGTIACKWLVSMVVDACGDGAEMGNTRVEVWRSDFEIDLEIGILWKAES